MRITRAPMQLGALLLVSTLTTARASAADDEVEQARGLATQAAAAVPEVAKGVSPTTRPRTGIAERIAAAELLLRNRDWERAVQVLSQVIELHRR